jgi:hypothetical protein
MRNRRFEAHFAAGRPAVAVREGTPSRARVKRATRLLTIVAVVVLALVPARALAARPAPVFPPDSSPYGHTYSEWAASWWQWALTQPVETNPVLDETGVNCAQGQQGPVWFLAGSFGSAPVKRTCTVPADRAILIPVVNFAQFAFPLCDGTLPPDLCDPAEKRTEEYLRMQAAFVADATHLRASVDDVKVAKVASYYEQSTLFSLTLPADNLFGLPEGFVLGPCVDAGYYVMIAPLTPGKHKVAVSGALPGGFSVDVKYDLTIA